MKRKLVLGACLALIGLSAGGSADAMTLPGWAGSPDPCSEVTCWHEGFGRVYYNGSVCGSTTVWDDFAIPIPVKQGGDITVTWQAGNECTGLCLGQMEARRVVYNADGSLNNASSWNAGSGVQNAPNITLPTNGSVQLWIHARDPVTTQLWISRVSTSGLASLG